MQGIVDMSMDTRMPPSPSTAMQQFQPASPQPHPSSEDASVKGMYATSTPAQQYPMRAPDIRLKRHLL